MKQWIYIIASLFLLPFAAGCEREVMEYEGKDAIYFDVQWGSVGHGAENVWSHQIYSLVAFSDIEEPEYELRLKVGVAGSVVDYDRPFRVTVVPDSTNAIAGEEYDGFSEEQVIKAGENRTYIALTVKRSERMMTDTVKIQLRLHPNEYFELPFSDVGTVPGRWDNDTQTAYSKNYDPTIHNIFANNILKRPAGWMAIFGDFSAKKYQFLMDVSGYGASDFKNQPAMLYGLGQIVARRASAYLKEQYAKGREYWVLDEDGSMMYVSGVSWAQGTRPEEMQDY